MVWRLKDEPYSSHSSIEMRKTDSLGKTSLVPHVAHHQLENGLTIIVIIYVRATHSFASAMRCLSISGLRSIPGVLHSRLCSQGLLHPHTLPLGTWPCICHRCNLEVKIL